MTIPGFVRQSALSAVIAATLAATPLAAQQAGAPVKEPAKAVDRPGRQGFNVVLLLGDVQGGEFLEGVPVSARKAIADMKDFLPYKNYRLLDSQWTLCCAGAAPAITRLRGVDDVEFELELRSSPVWSPGAALLAGAYSMRFVLRESMDGSGKVGAGSAPKGSGNPAESMLAEAQMERELFQLQRERLDLSEQVTVDRTKVDIGLKDPNEVNRMERQLQAVTSRIEVLSEKVRQTKQLREAQQAGRGGRAVIDTSFRMEDGETVVVGTSGVKGTKRALIALLTAVAERPKSR